MLRSVVRAFARGRRCSVRLLQFFLLDFEIQRFGIVVRCIRYQVKVARFRIQIAEGYRVLACFARRAVITQFPRRTYPVYFFIPAVIDCVRIAVRRKTVAPRVRVTERCA